MWASLEYTLHQRIKTDNKQIRSCTIVTKEIQIKTTM